MITEREETREEEDEDEEEQTVIDEVPNDLLLGTGIELIDDRQGEMEEEEDEEKYCRWGSEA